jgi:CO/xanthine dehydrogenase Mo-binding subunit
MEVTSMVLGAAVDDLELKDRCACMKGSLETKAPSDEVVRHSIQKRGGNPIIGKGYVKAMPDVEFYPSISKGQGRFTETYALSAAGAELEVDQEIGRIKVLKIAVDIDCGYDINPINVEGQLESRAIMILGDALFEEVLIEEGRHMKPILADYKIPEILDMPEVETIIVRSIDPKGPYGAKEVGEFARGSVPPAIANALFDAIGARIYSLPLTPEKVLNALSNRTL